jgi:outer membrane protein assembly factor BamB
MVMWCRSLARANFALLGVLAASVGPTVGAQETPAQSWPQFRGNHQLSGVSASALPDRLTLLWTYEAEEVIESSAAIVDGTVYVGVGTGDLLALDLATGKLRWAYRASDMIGESSPAVATGRVYIGDLSGVVHGVDASSGRGLWTFETDGEIKSSPVVLGDHVLVGSYDGFLYALDSETGELAWKVETQGPIHATASVWKGIAYVAGCDEMFRGIRVSDGQQVVEVSSGAYTGASPALMAGKAFYGTLNSEVLAVDLERGNVVWRYSHPERQFPFYASAAVVGSRVVVGGRDKKVHCLDTGSGRPLWSFLTRARVESSPVVAGSYVYVGSNDGRLYVLDLVDGKKLWEFNAGAPLTASPAVAAGRLVIGSHDGQIFCFR